MPKNPTSTTVEESRLNPKVLAFKPRQVLLLQSSTTNTTKPPTRRNMKKEENKASLSATQKATLLGCVAQYLQRSGFSKTLKKLRSEAKIEEVTTADSLFDLEEVFLKFLGICDHGSKDIENVKVPVSTDAKSQEKKKSKKKSDSLVKEVQFSAKVLKESADNIVDELAKPKDKKNKKSKMELESLGGNIIEHQSESVVKAIKEQPNGVALLDNKKLADAEAGNKKDIKPKREKKKLYSVAVTDKVEQHFSNDGQGVDDQKANKNIKGSQVVNSDMVNASGNHKSAKTKEKKEKRKDQTVSKNLGNGNSEEFEAGKPDQTESKQDDLRNSKEHATDKLDKGAKKRKRLASEENAAEPDDDEKPNEESKRRKSSVSEEAKLSEQSTKSEGEEAKQTNGHTNGDLQENGKKSDRVNSTMKLRNVEPTSVKRFQRVNVEELVLSDERLKDNSYWAKDGAETGYGAKAQEVLGQVKGRDFRHEKTKKKRGTYRGGQIDLQSHSVKFNYSDDE